MDNQKIKLDRQLLNAAYTKNLKSALLAIDAGADIYAINRNNVSVVRHTVKQGSLPILNLLFEKGLSCGHYQVKDAYFDACVQGNTAMVDVFIDHGIDKNYQNEAEHSGLIIAIINNRLSLVKHFIDKNVDLELPDNKKESPLLLAARAGKTAIVSLLIEAGVDLESRTAFGTTPLRAAAMAGRVETLKVLIDAGANIEAKDHRGRTVLDLDSNTEQYKASMTLIRSHLEQKALDQSISNNNQTSTLDF